MKCKLINSNKMNFLGLGGGDSKKKELGASTNLS
jgi:hypothetical protein